MSTAEVVNSGRCPGRPSQAGLSSGTASSDVPVLVRKRVWPASWASGASGSATVGASKKDHTAMAPPALVGRSRSLTSSLLSAPGRTKVLNIVSTCNAASRLFTERRPEIAEPTTSRGAGARDLGGTFLP
eukprot:3459013-Pyramimonas_sp.AAC.1